MRIAERLKRLACACVAAGTVVLSLAGSAEAAAWLIQPTPHLARGYSGYLVGVSCTSGTDCTAVGWYATVGTEAVGPALAERWDGRGWSIQPLPTSPGAAFSGVSCTSSTDCTAVGDYSVNDDVAASFAERWDGQVWSIQPIPTSSTAQLDGVSCASTTACTAVGEQDGASAARWDGLRWSIQPLPHPASLSAVSCTSATACTAVGDAAARWDGMRWSFQSTPRPPFPPHPAEGIEHAELDGVSCPSSKACTAVGNYSYEEYGEQPGEVIGVELTLAERWNGRRWSIQVTPNPSDSNEARLLGVSCTSSNACIAVGDDYSRDGRVSLAERWDGKRWSIQPTPNHPGADATELDAVSCTSNTGCTAVGSYVAALPVFPGVSRPLVERLTPTTPARAKLTGIPAACVRAPFTARITGVGIASVNWSVDGSRISGRTIHRGASYAASVIVTPERHRLTARVTFVPSSHAAPRTFRKTINGCPPPSNGLG